MEIQLREYDYNGEEYVEVGSVDTYTLAHNLDPQAMAHLLEDYVNTGAKGVAAGQRPLSWAPVLVRALYWAVQHSVQDECQRTQGVGRVLHDAHRALQAYVIQWAPGVVVGLAEQEAWDPRNARALAIARHVEKLHDDYYEGVEPLDDYGIPGR